MRNFIIALTIALSPHGAILAQDSFGGGASEPQQQPQQEAKPQQMQQPMQTQQQGYPQGQMPQQGYPSQQMPGQQMPGQQMPGQQMPGQQMRAPDFSRVEQIENQDFGVAPTKQLHNGAMHGPTPTTIPGGLMITTEALFTTLSQNPQGMVIFDVLGGPEMLPGAYTAAPASAPGSFNDQTQKDFGAFIQQVTNGNKAQPVLFYCQSAQCWMSYNAALRAINMGYSQVLWYRGGIEAWKMAGLPTQGAQAMGGQQGQQGQQGGRQQPY